MTIDPEFPYYEITLKPVPHPTVDQIRFFHNQWKGVARNLLESRRMLMQGGYAGFMGLHRYDRLQPLREQLDALELPYEVKATRWRDENVVDKRR